MNKPKSKRSSTLLFISLSYLTSVMIYAGVQSEAAKDRALPPNIVIMLADDMNWFDVSAYNRLYDYVPQNIINAEHRQNRP